MNKVEKRESGFTIIEVVLVLAIAGLIFLIVFLAVPALQRNQRDTQRRNDLSRTLGALGNYQANNKGDVPDAQTEVDTLRTGYLAVTGDTFADPSGTNYAVTLSTVAATGTATVPDNTIYYYTSATCSGENAAAATGTRKVAVRINLEGAGSYCINN